MSSQAKGANTAKTKAAISSVAWSAMLTVLKFAAGFASNSIGLISEGLHSLLDFIATCITFFAVRWAATPADRHYPFGHGKVENFSALIETLLLFATSLWIIWEAMQRLIFQAPPVEPTWWAFAVLAVSILVDAGRSAMLFRVAKKYHSQALEADALHFSTDILSASVVLAGLVCIYCAKFAEPDSVTHTLLSKADAVAALAVAVIIQGVCWRMATRAFAALMDGGTESETKKLRQTLQVQAPAFRIKDLRVRESGSNYFVTLSVDAPPAMRVDDASELAAMLEKTVRDVLPGAETIVHFEPQKIQPPDLYASARNIAALHGLAIHSLAMAMRENGLHITVHVELPPQMPLTEAHKIVSSFESDLGRRIGAARVITHMEPLEDDKNRAAPLHSPPAPEKIEKILEQIMPRHPEITSTFDREIWTLGGHADLSFRCKTSGSATVLATHRLASRVEAELRSLLPGLGRINIHFEPE